MFRKRALQVSVVKPNKTEQVATPNQPRFTAEEIALSKSTAKAVVVSAASLLVIAKFSDAICEIAVSNLTKK